ncbi:MAG: caspase family protein, partial [Bacteroidales bacterium]
VIGNSAYAGGKFLKNPENDANLMIKALQNLGFEVISRTNADKKNMERAIREFSEKLPNYNVALFYYAGHGVQVDGMNYLIPTDAELNKKEDCKWEAVSVNFIVEEFEKYPNNTNIVILDACRNDPFKSWSRGGERGFKAIVPTSGTIIAFATSEGATASDGTGQNGLFTQELVKQMQVEQPIESVFKKTRVEVEKHSNGSQSPQEWSKLKGDFWFKK